MWSRVPTAPADIAVVVARAHAAFRSGRAEPGLVRARRLRDAATAVADARDELSDLLVRTIGKPGARRGWR